MSAMSRSKGKRGEREVAELLRSHGFPGRRGAQHRGGPDSPDVVGLPGVHIEAKRCEQIRIWAAIEQAKRDCKPGDLATVWHRSNGRSRVVILGAEDFLALMRAIHADLVR